MEKFSAQPPLLAGYADSTPQKFVRNVCVLHVGRKFWEKHHDLCKNLSLNCPNSSLPSGEGGPKGRMRANMPENPHPALRATLSRRERDTPLHDGQAKTHSTQPSEPTTGRSETAPTIPSVRRRAVFRPLETQFSATRVSGISAAVPI